MPSKPPSPENFPTLAFPSASEFTAFLSTSSTTVPGIYLKLAKKTSGIPSITASEVVECALCYGWIDGRANSLDSNYWTIRLTPRRKKSIWSKKNVDTVERLISEGRMMEKGLEAVEEAKADGRWDKAYVGMAAMEVPPDLEAALEGETGIRAVWDGMSKSDRFIILVRLSNVSDKGREKCLRGVVEKLRGGTIPALDDASVVEKPGKKQAQKKEKGKSVKGEKPTGVAKKTTIKKQAIPKAKLEKKTSVQVEEGIPSRREGLRRRP